LRYDADSQNWSKSAARQVREMSETPASIREAIWSWFQAAYGVLGREQVPFHLTWSLEVRTDGHSWTGN
jgi:hypothetical protein